MIEEFLIWVLQHLIQQGPVGELLAAFAIWYMISGIIHAMLRMYENLFGRHDFITEEEMKELAQKIKIKPTNLNDDEDYWKGLLKGDKNDN